MTANPPLIRSFPTELHRSEPRRLTGRLVPYNVVTDVLDELPGGRLDVYREGFRRGAFAPQASSPEPGVLRRIGLVHTHDGGLGYLGPFVGLREEADGLWGDVAVLRSRADDVDDLLAAGVEELSVEFRLPLRGQHTEVDDAGVRWRTRAHLDQVALEPRGAYGRGARVAAFRADADALLAEQAEADAALAAEAAAVEAAAERRRRFDELTGDRLAAAAARQAELTARYGLQPPG